MREIKESLVTPVKYEYDVVVAGGGVAGIAAALAAARQGAKVALIEKQFVLGGLATAGLITIYLPICDGEGHQVSFGLAEELFKLSICYGHEAMYPKPWLEGGSKEEKKKTRYEVRFNAQLFAIAAEQLLLKEGVTIMYGTGVSAVSMKGDKIDTVIIENKSGRSAVSVKSVVDTTGDADVCAMAGEDTVLFKQQNVLAAWYYRTGKEGYDLKPLGWADIPDDEKSEEQKVKSLGVKRYQGLDGDELSQMVCDAHKYLLEDVLEKQKADPSYMPVTIATIPQVRMTRRIAGAYTMTTLDDRREFADTVGMASNWKKRGPVYEIPFSALHGKKVKNLLTAGRCISSEESMWDVTRVIPVCAVTGEAAGVAAAMTDDVTTVDLAALQQRLVKQGVKLYYSDIDWD